MIQECVDSASTHQADLILDGPSSGVRNIRACVNSVAQLLFAFSDPPSTLSPAMPEYGNLRTWPNPSPESNPATTAVLNTDIETLAPTNAVEISPAEATFESAIVILTLVRVRAKACHALKVT